MEEKLKGIVQRLEALQERLADPAVYADPALMKRLSREQRELEPIAAAWRAYQKAQGDLEAARELLGDPEFREMAQEELQSAKNEMERLEEELKRLLLPKDPNDEKNVIMEIRGGVGGEEAMLFAADLFRMYAMYAESKGWKLEIVNRNETELGGI